MRLEDWFVVLLGVALVWLVSTDPWYCGRGCSGEDGLGASVVVHPRGWELDRGDWVRGEDGELWVRVRGGGGLWARFAPREVGPGCWRSVYLGDSRGSDR
mgnify:FL=1